MHGAQLSKRRGGGGQVASVKERERETTLFLPRAVHAFRYCTGCESPVSAEAYTITVLQTQRGIDGNARRLRSLLEKALELSSSKESLITVKVCRVSLSRATEKMR